jgi:hypothetical protein
MKSDNVFSLICGAIFGMCVILLLNRKMRASLIDRSPWLTANPQTYVIVVASSALTLLAIAYVIVTRVA